MLTTPQFRWKAREGQNDFHICPTLISSSLAPSSLTWLRTWCALHLECLLESNAPTVVIKRKRHTQLILDGTYLTMAQYNVCWIRSNSQQLENFKIDSNFHYFEQLIVCFNHTKQELVLCLLQYKSEYSMFCQCKFVQINQKKSKVKWLGIE